MRLSDTRILQNNNDGKRSRNGENEGWGVVRTSKKSSSLAHILTVLWESRHRCVGTQNNNDDHNDNGGNSFEIIMMIMKAMILLIL